MGSVRIIVVALMTLVLGAATWGVAEPVQPAAGNSATVLAFYGEAVDSARPVPSPDMSTWIKSAQARCPPGQLVFLTNACGCNGACCACSAQAPYLDHCSCRCVPTPPTTCNTGFSAGRR